MSSPVWNALGGQVIGSTLTGVLQTYFMNELMDILAVPKDARWYAHGVVAMGYPTGKWGVGARKPVQEVASRNSWQGDLGFSVPAPLWPK